MQTKQAFSEGACTSDKCSATDADFQCINCGTYYCGVSCQMSHWPTHKDVCIPRLVLASKRPTVTSKLMNTVAPGKVEAVHNLPPKILTDEAQFAPKLDLQTRIENLRKQKTDIVFKCDRAMRSSMLEKAQLPKIDKFALQTITNHLVRGHMYSKVVNNEESTPKSGTSETPATLQNGPFPDPGKVVKISYIDSDKLYIYDAGIGPHNEANIFRSMIRRSLQCAQTVKEHLAAPPQVGDILFAPFEDEFYRAVVKSIKNEVVQVFFPDFGNSLKTEWKKLKEIPDPKIKYAKTVTHPVWIDNVKTFTPRMREFLETLVDTREFVLMTVIDMPGTHMRMVEMRNKRDKYDLSEKLLALQDPVTNLGLKTISMYHINKSEESIKTNLVSQLSFMRNSPKLVATNPDTYRPVFISNMTEFDINASKQAELVITFALYAFTKQKISVVMKSNASVYEKLINDVQIYGEIDPNSYSPTENEIVLLKVKGVWYRAVTDAVKHGSARQFYLLDLPSFVAVENTLPVIRRYPPALTRNLYVVECIVENPRFLLKNTRGDESEVALLAGIAITADIYQTIDDDAGETTHLIILSME